MIMGKGQEELLTFGEHLEVLRKMFIRIIIAVFVIGVLVFCLKDITFSLLMAPTDNEFCFYRWVERVSLFFGSDFSFDEFSVQIISTELSAQFMTHLTSSVYISLLLASPYILYELFAFIAPALYENERRYSVIVVVLVYLLFIAGVMLSYFVIFPISFRFLATYQVSDSVINTITLSSYISTFSSLTFMMGIVFQLPVLSYVLARLGMISSGALRHFRKHAILVIAIVSAIITPPDVMTCLLVMGPLCLLYECSIRVVAFVDKRRAL